MKEFTQRNEVQNKNSEISEIHEIYNIYEIHEYNEVATPNFPTFQFHSTIDDLIDHHVLSTLGNSQGYQLSPGLLYL